VLRTSRPQLVSRAPLRAEVRHPEGKYSLSVERFGLIDRSNERQAKAEDISRRVISKRACRLVYHFFSLPPPGAVTPYGGLLVDVLAHSGGSKLRNVLHGFSSSNRDVRAWRDHDK
jgi:hypothetical protein